MKSMILAILVIVSTPLCAALPLQVIPGLVHIDYAKKEMAYCAFTNPKVASSIRCFFMPFRVVSEASEDCILDKETLRLTCGAALLDESL